MAWNCGDQVKWKWGNGWGYGTIKDMFAERTTRTIDGSEITRNGSPDNRALYLEQEDGKKVLKLESEVEKA